MKRLHLLDENRLIELIRRTRKDLADLRHAPQTFGSDSVRTYRIFSDDQWDIEVTGVMFNNTVIEVRFTPASGDAKLSGVLDFDYVAETDPSSFTEISVEPYEPDGGVDSVWRVYLSASDTFPAAYARLKFYFFANGSGTFTATLL